MSEHFTKNMVRRLFVASACACAMLASACDRHKEKADRDIVPEAESASPLAVAVRWRGGPPQGVRRTDQSIVAVLASASKDPVIARVTLVGSGLDGRVAEKPMGRFKVSVGSDRVISVRLSELPVQSVGLASAIELRAEAISGTSRPLSVVSKPVYAVFEPDFQTATLFGEEGPTVQVGRPDETDPAVFLGRARPLADAVFNVAGRVRTTGGRFVDVNRLPPVRQGPLIQHGSFVLKGGWWDSLRQGWADMPEFPLGTDSDPNTYRLCSTWRAAYDDAGFGEDFATSKGFNDLPARYAHVIVTTKANQAHWQGYLDAAGCTPYIPLDPGDYVLWQDGYMFKDGIGIDVYYRDQDNLKFGLTLLTGFSVAATPVGATVAVTPLVHDNITRAAAVMSEVLISPDAGLVPDHVYRVRADQPCPNFPDWGACGSASGLYLGPSIQTGGHTSTSKFIIAHEFGHVVQDIIMGFPNFDYSDVALQALCRCDHVVSSNAVHCLQSREFDGGAMVEGFAQFYASKVWNDESETDCTFVYYKEINFFGVKSPPEPISCRTPVRWMKNFCPAVLTGTEWDWLNFLWDVNTAPAEARTTVPDLAEIFRAACGGFNCNSLDEVHWSDLLNAAKQRFGPQSPKALRFEQAGVEFGVDS